MSGLREPCHDEAHRTIRYDPPHIRPRFRASRGRVMVSIRQAMTATLDPCQRWTWRGPMGTDGSWQPLSARLGGTPIDQTWQEGIPAWINRAVREWLQLRLSDSAIRDRLFARMHYHDIGPDSELVFLLPALSESDLLDWIDGVLDIAETTDGSWIFHAERLEVFLREGHSIWRVSDSHNALERRQDAIVTAAAHRATETACSTGVPAAADHLQAAWAAVYGLHPDPSKAFREAILAVEAVAVPVIVPTPRLAMLGDVLRELRAHGDQYGLAIVDKTGSPASVTPVTELVELLWRGHTDRHEGNIPAIPITQGAAEMAVHAAATLVQWFASDAVRRK